MIYTISLTHKNKTLFSRETNSFSEAFGFLAEASKIQDSLTPKCCRCSKDLQTLEELKTSYCGSCLKTTIEESNDDTDRTYRDFSDEGGEE